MIGESTEVGIPQATAEIRTAALDARTTPAVMRRANSDTDGIEVGGREANATAGGKAAGAAGGTQAALRAIV